MNTTLAEQRQQVHALIDGLPERQLFAVRYLLELLVEPLLLSLANAPVDEEDFKPETIQTTHRANEFLDREQPVPHDTVVAGLDLLELQEIETSEKLAWLRSAVQDGLDALQRGEGRSFASTDDLGAHIRNLALTARDRQGDTRA